MAKLRLSPLNQSATILELSSDDYDPEPVESPTMLADASDDGLLLAASYRCQRCAWSMWSKELAIVRLPGGAHVLCEECKDKVKSGTEDRIQTNLKRRPTRRTRTPVAGQRETLITA